MIVSLALLEEYYESIKEQTGEVVQSYKNFQEAKSILPEAEIVISWGNFSGDMLKECKKLKWLFILNAGLEKLPFIELEEKGVLVNAGRVHGTQMAEHGFGIMIAFNRQLHQYIRNQQQKSWKHYKPMTQLAGKTLCIIGAGSIGREFANKAKAFDMKVIGLKKHKEALEHFDEVWEMDQLYKALGLADYIVLLTPLTEETYHLIGQKEFSAMKPECIFINMSRGDTVDEAALIDTLGKGYIAGAGLDVFHQEPLPETSPLWEMENVILTPHSSALVPDMMDSLVAVFIKSLICYRQGKPLPNRIDLKNKY